MHNRPEKPVFLIQYEEWRKAGPPRFCHTCENYDMRGHCIFFNMRPPESFTQAQNNCEHWLEELPF
jgi:NAD-dependent SIR2 family protein deacetylase